MPGSTLVLKADFGYDGRPDRGMRGQGYLMAELADERGAVIDGFRRDGCVVHDIGSGVPPSDLDRYGGIPLSWEGDTGAKLAGQQVQLRVWFRDARVYGLTT